MVLGAALLAAYIVYALGASAPGVEHVKEWARVMLVFIGIGVASQIVIQILFHIGFAVGIAVKEREREDKKVERIVSASMVEDERDKLIQLKAAHIGYIFAGSGIIACLAALAFGQPVVTALHIMMGALFLGSLAEGVLSVVLQEKGVRNG
jgi:hypothetical protein